MDNFPNTDFNGLLDEFDQEDHYTADNDAQLEIFGPNPEQPSFFDEQMERILDAAENRGIQVRPHKRINVVTKTRDERNRALPQRPEIQEFIREYVTAQVAL